MFLGNANYFLPQGTRRKNTKGARSLKNDYLVIYDEYILNQKHFPLPDGLYHMEFKPGDMASTAKGDGYVNEVIGEEIIINLIDGDDRREVFEVEQVSLLPD